ncbi:MAG: ATP-binding protein [Candidatus Fermentibacteraceae bacterium]
MKLRRKILFGYSLALILMAAVVTWAVFNLVRLGQASDAILRENYKSILAAESMVDAIERQDSAILLIMLAYDDEGLSQFRRNEAQFLLWLGRAKDNITIEGEAAILDSMEAGYSRYLTAFSSLREVLASSPGAAGSYYHETVLPQFTSVRDMALQLREINHNTMHEASREASAVSRKATWSTLVIAVLGIGLALAFSLLLSKRLVRPIRQMMEATERLAAGDYETMVPEGGSDELGRLAGSFNEMARKIGSYHRLNVKQIVAEKRKSEAVLRSISDGVMVIDTDHRITNINPRACRILEIDPGEAEGKHFLEVVKNEGLFELVKDTLETGRSPRLGAGEDIISTGTDESPRHYMFSITPVVQKGGDMTGVVLLLRDVTRLKELDRMKSDFIMTASHELKTPLHSLGMSIDLLLESATESLSGQQKELLDAAHEELQRLKSLISDLLDLSRIESGHVDMDLDSIPTAMLVEKALAVFESQASDQGIELVAEVPEDIPEVRADANKITWVLTNLIGNALRYAQSRIAVSAQIIGSWVHVSVEDDGQGIPPEYQSRIFDKFVRVDGDSDRKGTGLGLSICKEIVRAHKGTIWVDSTPGEGSTFTLTLPVSGKPEEDGDRSESNTDSR